MWYSHSAYGVNGPVSAKGHYQDAYVKVRDYGKLIGENVEGSQGTKRTHSKNESE